MTTGEFRDPYRNNPAYKIFRAAVIKRDKGKCRMPGCKYRGKKIQVHHISTFSSTINLRYEPKNGICLCAKCHRSISGKELYYASMFNLIINGDYL